MNFIAIGDNCVDSYVKQKKVYAGGCSINFSVYMKQLGETSAYIGAIGSDENGKIISNALKKQKVDYSHIHVLEGETAVTEIELVNNDRKFISYNQGVLMDLKLDENDFEYIRKFDYLHTSVYGNIDKYLENISKDIEICYDFANKLTLNDLNTILKNVSYAFYSYDKDDKYIREFLKSNFSQNIRCQVATLGENGSLAYDGNNFYYRAADETAVVDTIGAGDSFIAGFMYGISKNYTISKCLEQGSKRADKTISYFGAF